MKLNPELDFILFSELLSKYNGGTLKTATEERYRYYCPNGPEFKAGKTFLFARSFIQHLQEEFPSVMHKIVNKYINPSRFAVCALVFDEL